MVLVQIDINPKLDERIKLYQVLSGTVKKTDAIIKILEHGIEDIEVLNNENRK